MGDHAAGERRALEVRAPGPRSGFGDVGAALARRPHVLSIFSKTKKAQLLPLR